MGVSYDGLGFQGATPSLGVRGRKQSYTLDELLEAETRSSPHDALSHDAVPTTQLWGEGGRRSPVQNLGQLVRYLSAALQAVF